MRNCKVNVEYEKILNLPVTILLNLGLDIIRMYEKWLFYLYLQLYPTVISVCLHQCMQDGSF